MKIDIFSGFLGSGKTTLIKKLIKEAYQGEKVVLIENEFGEIGIDGGFLKDSGIEITEMNSGCICCSLVGDFSKALKQVTEQFSPDRIIIEPSGVGKLSDVVRAVKNGLDVEINSKTTVINAKKCLMYAKNFGEFFIDQLENADCVVLSHTDVATQSKIDESLAYVKEHNPDAMVVVTPITELDGKAILAAMEKKSASAQKLAEEMLHEHHHDEDEHCHCHHHHDDDDDEDEHEHHHHHHDDDDDEDEDEHCHCHHHHDDDDDEDEDEHCHCHHHHDDDDDEDEHEHHHHYDENGNCSCGHHHHHHGHDADEVFTSFGRETTVCYTENGLKDILNKLDDEETYGLVLRAKGIVKGEEGWLHFDYIPDGIDVRKGSSDVIGKICVIGSKIKEDALEELFGLNK